MTRPTSGSSRSPYVMATVTQSGSLGLFTGALDEMNRRGWRLHVAFGKPARYAPRWLAYTQISMTRGITPTQDVRALSQLVFLLRRERPDVLIGATPKAAVLSMLAGRIAGVPIRVFYAWGARWDGMTGPQATLLRRLDQLAASSATEVVAVSASLADLFVSAGITHTRPLVIGSGGTKGVDPQRFKPRVGKVPGHTIGYVGRLSADKGVRDLLDVFDRCRTVLPDCRLVVAGGIDGAQPIDEQTQRRLEQPGVQWLGSRGNIEEILGEFDVLVFPSIREGLPNAVIEAAACAVPTVGYRTTGVVDAVSDGVTGRLVPLGDVQALTDATLDVLTSGVAASMGPAAREWAVERFAEEKVVHGFVDHIAELPGRVVGHRAPSQKRAR